MDDPFPSQPEDSSEHAEQEVSQSAPEAAPEPVSEAIATGAGLEPTAAPVWHVALRPAKAEAPPDNSRRDFLHNLYLLLGLTLAAFTLTAWILVRVQSPLDLLSTGPQQVVNAQLRALDRGELRAAYDMFSTRYRQEVTFNEWHELVVTHWRMFHTEVLDAGQVAQSGSRATLELHLRGADDKPYRARFTLIRVSGRWWVDDLHWTDEQDEDNTLRT